MQDSLESAREEMWLTQATFEAHKHKSMRYLRGRGTCVLFILDISESMRGEGIRSLKRGVSDILDEFSKYPKHDENVATIVFGKETKFLQYYSNNYGLIKQSIENLEPSGPSPLTAAFILALGGLYEGSAHTSAIGDFQVQPIIVVFTDGRLTHYEHEGVQEDKSIQIPDDSVLAPLFSITHKIGSNYPIYCFPVGSNPNHSLLFTISMISNGGKVLDINKAGWLGRISQHYVVANTVYRMTNRTRIEKNELRNLVHSAMPEKSCEDDDLDRIRELLNNSSRTTKDPDVNLEDAEENFFIEKHSSVPTLGTRVRRGPHWTFQNQDSEGAGTVVGHGDLAGMVYVEWDTGIRCDYIHGQGGIYNVVVCDEPRIPEDGFVAVGCFVKRGPDWKWEDQDGGEGSIGTVYRVKDDATVYFLETITIIITVNEHLCVMD